MSHVFQGVRKIMQLCVGSYQPTSLLGPLPSGIHVSLDGGRACGGSFPHN